MLVEIILKRIKFEQQSMDFNKINILLIPRLPHLRIS